MRSLRSQLVLFWVFLLVVGVALGSVMASIFQQSAGAQVAEARAVTRQACQAIATRYARSVPQPVSDQPRIDLLQVLLQLVLREVPHVEGGVWQASAGMLAYAYPTYEGSGVKHDVPTAEQPLIVELARQAVQAGTPQTDVVRGSREALVVSACPLASTGTGLAAWTMTRTHQGALAAQGSLRFGLGVLLAALLASAGWLGLILLRGLRHVRRLEARLVQADGQALPELEPTGVRELDRIVHSFNRHRERFEEARAQLRDAARQRSRDQRLAALGRMTGAIAHEIRNPIAAMRLKAENALAADPARQPDALRAIVGQIDRLDGLVQSLLALVRPVTLSPRAVELAPWLAERRDTAQARATARDVALTVEAEGAAVACFDPLHLARALDNLIDNALRHAPAGGRVRVSARAEAGGPLRLRVDDDGPGIAEPLQAQLFEPFATGRADGTGLGLALAREAVLAHGGDIGYQRVGGLTRFEVELPWRAS
ncbi:sensor histidine kinase [Xylophilus sp. Kf1]|nr:sensor histidine kinase [Xylophilus sp. Kf1]